MPNVYAFDEDILVADYPLHASVTLSAIREEYQKRIEINNYPHLLLVRLNGLVSFDGEAQGFLASSEHKSITKAVAILANKNAGYYEQGKRILELFKRIHKLEYPIKSFDDEADALSWLRSQMNNG